MYDTKVHFGMRRFHINFLGRETFSYYIFCYSELCLENEGRAMIDTVEITQLVYEYHKPLFGSDEGENITWKPICGWKPEHGGPFGLKSMREISPDSPPPPPI